MSRFEKNIPLVGGQEVRMSHRNRVSADIWSYAAMALMICALGGGCAERFGTRVELSAESRSLARARYIEISVYTGDSSGGSDLLRERVTYRFCDELGEAEAHDEPCMPVAMQLQEPFSLHVFPGVAGPSARFRMNAALYDTQRAPSASDAPFSTVEVQADFHPSEDRLLRVGFSDACQDMLGSGPGRTCWRGEYRGSCFDTQPLETNRDYLSSPTCGECGECGRGVCLPRSAGSACGCEGETCDRLGQCAVLRPVARISSGYKHTCARLNETGPIDDVFFCWGSTTLDDSGYHPSSEPTLSPTPSTMLASVPDDELSMFYHFDSGALDEGGASSSTCAIFHRDRALHCWGNASSWADPDAIRQAPGGGRWEQVGVGGAHVCAITTEGAMYCWGANAYRNREGVYEMRGALGIGPEDTSVIDSPDFREPPTHYRTPRRVFGDRIWSRLSVGRYHTCALDSESQLYCWGFNKTGQTGVGHKGYVLVPTLIRIPGHADETWAQVTSGGFHTCALSNEGEVWCWGGNGRGNIGQGYISEDIPSPRRVTIGVPVSGVECGTSHCCAVTGSGTETDDQGMLYCWGSNSETQYTEPNGKVGAGGSASNSVMFPTLISSEGGWVSLALGEEHSCATREDGSLWCWGENLEGQLGLGDQQNRHEPTRVCIPQAAEEGS